MGEELGAPPPDWPQTGMGRDLGMKIMNKAVVMAAAGKPLGIKSVIAMDHLKDYLYIEAYKVCRGAVTVPVLGLGSCWVAGGAVRPCARAQGCGWQTGLAVRWGGRGTSLVPRPFPRPVFCEDNPQSDAATTLNAPVTALTRNSTRPSRSIKAETCAQCTMHIIVYSA